MQNPPELDELSPSDLSFWILSMFSQDAPLKQHMLQTDSVGQRFDGILPILDGSLKHTVASRALEGVFASDAADADADTAAAVAPDGPASTSPTGNSAAPDAVADVSSDEAAPPGELPTGNSETAAPGDSAAAPGDSEVAREQSGDRSEGSTDSEGGGGLTDSASPPGKGRD